MNIKWIIEPGIFNENYKIRSYLEKEKIDHIVIDYRKGYEQLENKIDKNDIVIPHGSFQLIDYLKNKNSYIFCDDFKFKCNYYYPIFGNYLLNENYIMIPFGDLERKKEWLYEKISNYKQLFFRPNSHKKIFSGILIDYEDWDNKYKQISFYNITEEEIVIVSEKKNIIGEWRSIIFNNNIIAISQHDYIDSKIEIRKVLEYIKNVLSSVKYNPDPIYTLDVVLLDNEEFKINEVGSFSCSDIYDCDPKIIINTVNNIVKKG